MGKMKELFIQLREQEATQQAIEHLSVYNTGILCPSCFNSKLFEYSEKDLFCKSCSQEFIRLENNKVRFK